MIFIYINHWVSTPSRKTLKRQSPTKRVFQLDWSHDVELPTSDEYTARRMREQVEVKIIRKPVWSAPRNDTLTYPRQPKLINKEREVEWKASEKKDGGVTSTMSTTVSAAELCFNPFHWHTKHHVTTLSESRRESNRKFPFNGQQAFVLWCSTLKPTKC